jgi:hypothetical protein
MAGPRARVRLEREAVGKDWRNEQSRRLGGCTVSFELSRLTFDSRIAAFQVGARLIAPFSPEKDCFVVPTCRCVVRSGRSKMTFGGCVAHPRDAMRRLVRLEEEVEMPLHRQKAVVQKQAVAKERVGLEKDVQTETQTVADELKKERVEVEGDVDASHR